MNYSVVFHVDGDLKILSVALRNAYNYLEALDGKSPAVAILINGEAIKHLRRSASNHSETINNLISRGVHFYACQNSMREHGITPEELVYEATIVPAGVVHLVELQREGFAYIKP